jgi:hypothetical protein
VTLLLKLVLGPGLIALVTLAGLAAVAAFSVIYAWTAVAQPAMWTFALFCFVLAVGVVGFGRDAVASRGSARRGPRAARRSV